MGLETQEKIRMATNGNFALSDERFQTQSEARAEPPAAGEKGRYL